MVWFGYLTGKFRQVNETIEAHGETIALSLGHCRNLYDAKVRAGDQQLVVVYRRRIVEIVAHVNDAPAASGTAVIE